MARFFLLLMTVIVSGMLFNVAAHADDSPTDFSNPALTTRYNALINELRCPKCENESLASSQAPIAGDIRNRIGTWLKAGESDDQIRQQLVARFGEYVLYKPRIESRTWFLWGFPGFAVVLGILILIWFIIRRQSTRVTELDASEKARLAQLLKRHAEDAQDDNTRNAHDPISRNQSQGESR